MRNNHRVGYITRQGLRNEILHERVFPMGVAVKTVVPKPCYDTTLYKIRINTTWLRIEYDSEKQVLQLLFGSI